MAALFPIAVSPAELPHVWRVRDLAGEEAVVASGHAALDAELPGGGWPMGSLVEVLQQRAGQHVWQLLLPGLVQSVRVRVGPVVLVAAPLLPFGPSLSAQGLPPERLLCIQADKPASRLWAAEQALRCADVVAVLAWLPKARGAELRRLHLAAHQHDKLLFVFRGLDARFDNSPARLRLWVEGVDAVNVHFLKRRGPPLASPVTLPLGPARLAELLASRSRKPAAVPLIDRRSHVLDRTVALP